MEGIPLLYTTRVWEVYPAIHHPGICTSYTPWVYTATYTPWVYHHPTLHPVYRSSCPSRGPLPVEEALGSKRRKPVGEEPLSLSGL